MEGKYIRILNDVYKELQAVLNKIDEIEYVDQKAVIFDTAIMTLDKYSKDVFGDNNEVFFIPSRVGSLSGSPTSVLRNSDCYYAGENGEEFYSNAYLSFAIYYSQLQLSRNQGMGIGKMLYDYKKLQDYCCVSVELYDNKHNGSKKNNVANIVSIKIPFQKDNVYNDTIINLKETYTISPDNGSFIKKLIIKDGDNKINIDRLITEEQGKLIEEYIDKEMHKIYIENIESIDITDFLKFLFYNLACYSLLSRFNYNYYFSTMVTTVDHGPNKSSPPGILIISTRNLLNDDQCSFLKLFANTIWNTIAVLDIKDMQRELEQQARKSAISQVLSRNLSHQHGSHVLSRLVHADQIRDLQDMHEGIRDILSKKYSK